MHCTVAASDSRRSRCNLSRSTMSATMDDGYTQSPWEYSDPHGQHPQSPLQSPLSPSHDRAFSSQLSPRDRDSSPTTGVRSAPPPTPSKSASPPPRSSTESFAKHSKWRDGASSLQRADTMSTAVSDTVAGIVEPTFDENVLRALCDIDVSPIECKVRERGTQAHILFIQCGVPLLLDRIKQSMVSCRVSLGTLNVSMTHRTLCRRRQCSLRSVLPSKRNTAEGCRNYRRRHLKYMHLMMGKRGASSVIRVLCQSF